MTGQDEQRVVDAHAETHHDRDDRGDLRHGEHTGHETDGAHPDEERDQRDHDRKAHRDEGAERDGQHDHGDEDADLLAARLCGTGSQTETGVVLHLHAGVTGTLDRVLRLLVLLRTDLLGVEGNGRECGGPVLAQGGPTGVVGISDGDHVLALGELGDSLLDGSLGARLVETRLGVEDDVRAVERFLRETVLEGVSSALRLRTGKAEGLVGSTAEGRVQHHRRDGNDDPCCEDTPWVAPGEVSEPVEKTRHDRAFPCPKG